MEPDFTDSKTLEQYSSAYTLSDMEIFVFPELLFSLVLANCMSPVIWRWLKDPWFQNIEKLSLYRRVVRVKQYIMDHYVFNLDLETWGLTTIEKELARFHDFINLKALMQSNALFGYEGDRYYFDLGIRRHFGLDKYTSAVIPYWKTETVEAMDAFRYKPGYRTGAGECVSLSALYAAALFIVAKIPFEDIFMLATPLHSQNYINVGDGILTNNRRIVTKNMWFSGTEIATRARRALEHEKVTIVAHMSGYLHTFYNQATIAKQPYALLQTKLSHFLQINLTSDILINFLREHDRFRSCFQFRYCYQGKTRYLEAEKVYYYEHNSRFQANGATREKLFLEIDEDEFYTEKLSERIIINDLELYLDQGKFNLDNEQHVGELKKRFCHKVTHARELLQELKGFTKTVPHLPTPNKEFIKTQQPIEIATSFNREKIIHYLKKIRTHNRVADLAFYAYRAIQDTLWPPYIKAAIERNPVTIEQTKQLTLEDILEKLQALPDKSIYEENRLAQPDEVWNFQRGSSLEKAFVLVTILKHRNPKQQFEIEISPQGVRVVGQQTFFFLGTHGYQVGLRLIV